MREVTARIGSLKALATFGICRLGSENTVNRRPLQ